MGGDSFQMSKFFVEEGAIRGDTITITGDDVNHIRKVLRLRTGEAITVCDGKGMDYSAEIEQLEAQYVSARVVGVRESGTEPPIEVVLFQGLPKSDKMDYIIQKTIELGISKIIPVITERTVVKIDNKKDAENKRVRWQRISLEAAKQCNRGMVPVVEVPVSFEKALELSKEYELCMIPYEKERNNKLKGLVKADPDRRKIAVFIGPEGGFSEEEIERAEKQGVKPVTLGTRILRTETAGIAVLAILMYELGDVG